MPAVQKSLSLCLLQYLCRQLPGQGQSRTGRSLGAAPPGQVYCQKSRHLEDRVKAIQEGHIADVERLMNADDDELRRLYEGRTIEK